MAQQGFFMWCQTQIRSHSWLFQVRTEVRSGIMCLGFYLYPVIGTWPYHPLKGAVAHGCWSSLTWGTLEEEWSPHLLRPLIPDEPRIRHCRRSRSTGSVHSDKRRWALVAISRSCLAVPAITDHNREKVLSIIGLYITLLKLSTKSYLISLGNRFCNVEFWVYNIFFK